MIINSTELGVCALSIFSVMSIRAASVRGVGQTSTRTPQHGRKKIMSLAILTLLSLLTLWYAPLLAVAAAFYFVVLYIVYSIIVARRWARTGPIYPSSDRTARSTWSAREVVGTYGIAWAATSLVLLLHYGIPQDVTLFLGEEMGGMIIGMLTLVCTLFQPKSQRGGGERTEPVKGGAV
ncbi:MAG: hypothetical protein C4K49_00335 [Candidatus Thorarchaeota archaeon]|nr:MAG: hypothetical protein C4K49_00335 [Candidatus Thorarchaeota archaeon]